MAASLYFTSHIVVNRIRFNVSIIITVFLTCFLKWPGGVHDAWI